MVCMKVLAQQQDATEDRTLCAPPDRKKSEISELRVVPIAIAGLGG
jgi:hypothetical protein